MDLEFKGTKGEWHISDYDLGCVKFSDSDFNNKDCDLYKHQYNNIEEMQANAKLIASAPDLLKALELMVNNFKEFQSLSGAKNQAILKAEKAIEKALK